MHVDNQMVSGTTLQTNMAATRTVMVVARWNPSEGGDRGGLETRVASVIFGS